MIKSVPFSDVNIGEGFWQNRQRLNADVTINAVRDRFKETGRFGALRCEWKEGMENKPHFFWDSDTAKWIESVGYILKFEDNQNLESEVDELIDIIAENQGEDGYFNSYFNVVTDEKRFSNRDRHELYCAGHLMEAAVSYYEATGKDKLLKCMCKYADYIEKVFVIEDSAEFKTPGHEEIELALVKLYHCTGEKRYLDLSKHFVDKRGCQEEVLGNSWTKPIYYQSHKPCREQTTAEGHSVRACYLYAGMADIAREYHDKELLNACEKIFDDIYYKKMYITAGLGQSCYGEAFTVPYDLQNSNAYTETCAAIAFVFFASRMQNLKLDSRFGDVIERAIYNGALSGVSLDGKHFFYENPLEINLSRNERNVSVNNAKERYPITQRVKVFNCSCCPPNVTRFISSIGNYIYGSDDETIYIHQYITSDTKINGTEIDMKSGYPYDGKTTVKINGCKKIAVRIPEYTDDNFSIQLNGEKANYEMKNGYAFVNIPDRAELDLCFDITPKAYYSNSHVYEDAGKCAICAGPIVYCAEGVDNGADLRSFRIPEKIEYTTAKNENLATTDIIVKCEKLTVSDSLYSYVRKFEPAEIRLIPYFAFANRGDSNMTVWLTAK